MAFVGTLEMASYGDHTTSKYRSWCTAAACSRDEKLWHARRMASQHESYAQPLLRLSLGG